MKVDPEFIQTLEEQHYIDDDVVVFADESGHPTGVGPKLASHNSDTRLHLAFSVFLFNAAGELLLQQRALGKKTWPGVWSNSCCGHLRPDEGVTAAAARRLRDELGITEVDLQIVLPDFRYRAELDGIVENEICPVLVGITKQSVNPNPAEINGVKWIQWDQFLETVEDPCSGISPWAVEEVRLLSASEEFNRWLSEHVVTEVAVDRQREEGV